MAAIFSQRRLYLFGHGRYTDPDSLRAPNLPER